eukprot:45079_1
MDDFIGLQRGKKATLVEVPQHGGAVFAARGTQRAIGRDGNCVDVSGVAGERRSQCAVGHIPDADSVVPAGRHDDWVRNVGRKANARHPLSVGTGGGVIDGEFALAEGVPQIDGLIPGATDNLSIIGRKSHRQNVLGVFDETTR